MRLVFATLLVLSVYSRAQEPQVSAQAPPDKVTHVTQDQVKAIDDAIKPFVEEARATYGAAKQKFLAGLPKDQSFFVTTRLHDKLGRFEQVFIAVAQTKNGVIEGKIWSPINRVSGYHFGDQYKFPESEIFDWLITHPDGSEEGNFVGKFMDTYHPQ